MHRCLMRILGLRTQDRTRVPLTLQSLSSMPGRATRVLAMRGRQMGAFQDCLWAEPALAMACARVTSAAKAYAATNAAMGRASRAVLECVSCARRAARGCRRAFRCSVAMARSKRVPLNVPPAPAPSGFAATKEVV
jgi:hypothetical protein